jgi:hypothetical protein
VTYHHDGLRDNSFEARERAGADPNDYGARASRDLIVTRGAGFRKEKNKKKRGVSAACYRHLRDMRVPSRLRRLACVDWEASTGPPKTFHCDRSNLLTKSSQSYVGGQITLQTHSIKFDD